MSVSEPLPERTHPAARCPNHDPHEAHQWERTIWRPLPPSGDEGKFYVVVYRCFGRTA